MKKFTTILILWTTTCNLVYSQALIAEPVTPSFLDRIYGKDSLVDHVLDNREKYRFQFILTDISEVDSSLQLNETYDFSEPSWYFYPASVVKLPTALLTLEKLAKMRFSNKSTLTFNTDFTCGNMKFVEESQKAKLSFEQMIRELIVVSNNTYYNSLYHFLTPKYINEELHKKGLNQTKIYKDFTGCEMPLNLRTHGFTVEDDFTSRTYYEYESQLELSEMANEYHYDSTKLLGSKHEYRGEIVDGPFDFNYNLEYPLKDIHATSMRLFFPEFFTEDQRWNIHQTDRRLMIKAMSAVPKDLEAKEYLDQKKDPDNLYKYIVHGDDNEKYDSIITCSKIGLSYGFVTETAYVFDPNTNRRYVLTVSMYVNSNDTVNDGKYEYEELAKPFLARFGQLILEM